MVWWLGHHVREASTHSEASSVGTRGRGTATPEDTARCSIGACNALALTDTGTDPAEWSGHCHTGADRGLEGAGSRHSPTEAMTGRCRTSDSVGGAGPAAN